MFGSKKRAAAAKAAHNAGLDREAAKAARTARKLRASALEDDAKWWERHAEQLKAQKLK